MRRNGTGVLLSASDLITMMGCAHATYLDLRQLGQDLGPAEVDATTELLQEKGREHEKSYLERLKREGRDVVEIPGDLPLADQVRRTRDAMQGGADVIYQGALLDPPWHGYSDFLLRVGRASALGDFSYEVADTKLARSAKPTHVLQLAVYSDFVAKEQGIAPHYMHVVLGDGTAASFVVPDFHYYGLYARKRLQAFIETPPQTSGELCGHCALCRWQTRCSDEWERMDHLRLVAGLRRDQAVKLRAAGYTTCRALAEIAPSTRIPRIQPETLAKLRHQAALQVGKRTDGKSRCDVLPASPGRGFARLPEPDAGDLFFDMEGDPLYDDGLEYLFGFVVLGEKGPDYVRFWAHDRNSEKAAFQSAVDFVVARLKANPKAHIYHYASYEESALKRLAMLHGTRENEIDELLRQRKFVDLYKVVREGIRVSEPAYSLKNLEVFYTTGRAGEVRTAGDSIVVYERWRRTGEAALLQEIQDYNEADCESLVLLRKWLLGLRPADTKWFVQTVVPEDDDDNEKRQELEQKTAGLIARLLDCPTEDRAFRELVGYLLEFHRREAKPKWWAMFDRQDAEEEQLIDDVECLAGLRRDGARRPVADKKSMVHFFKFPPQDFKLAVGDMPLRSGTLEAAGKIVALDEDAGTVALRLGPSRTPLPDALSLIPQGPRDDHVMRAAIERYVGEILAGDGRYAAITSILRREPPRLHGHVAGQPIVPQGADPVAATVESVARLHDSHLVVQGPPGTGKTYTSARAIVALLSAGKRVGVSAHSHKAINKLLEEVEATAAQKGVRFQGIKKSSKEDQYLGGSVIADTLKNEAVTRGHQLVAGTAWLFARPEFDGGFDHMFIDEAGQMSLANVVAIGVAARNIVLVGDQMQLSQPIQGVHPGGSGVSALDHILQGAATVPPNKGVFLPVTRRMHPSVCRFISDAVYDGRLLSDAATARQELVLGPDHDPELVPHGLRFIPVQHEGCSQRSDEEAQRIRELYINLLAQRWRDGSGTEAPIGPDDILVVSPYNMQVNRLREVLPAGARIGTVDKFQGQEAAVVLISMATSSAEDLPRDIGFLFSRNRLNVAISRARVLAAIVANPRLLEVPCKTIEDMRLVNGLCWAAAYANA